ncbi:MAG: polysaccharide biosynthesis protein [Acidobacteriaceae bacterium]|nr:polysaccharide biosynthesis protein [Acidobacteriaceae bacterium]
MRAHLSNSAYSVLEYVAQPAGMILAAPILLRHLGLASYGLWLIASAAVGAGSIVSSGFGDAVIQRIACLRASNDVDGVRRVISNMLAINLILGCTLAALLWLVIPFAVNRITHNDPTLHQACLWSLRVGALLIVIKSIESVFNSSQRAYERYGPAVRIGIATRLLGVALTIVLAFLGFGVVSLMCSTAALTIAGAITQASALRRHLGAGHFSPALDRATSGQLMSFGCFAWLQAVSSVIFGQADRLILGTALGVSAVAFYGTSVQLAQPIHGLTAAGLHFLFPYLAVRFPAEANASLRRPVLTAFAANLISACILSATVVLLGPHVLVLWMGPSFAAQASALLPIIALSFGLLAMNVTAHYTLMALGHVRIVTTANIVGGLLMLLAMTVLIPRHGLEGAALARLWYGPATLLLYLPLARLLLAFPLRTNATLEQA